MDRRDFIKLVGLSSLGFALGWDQNQGNGVATSVLDKSKSFNVRHPFDRWGKDIESARNLPLNILNSEEFAGAVDKMRGAMATRGLQTFEYTAVPIVNTNPNGSVAEINFIVRANQNGDLLFIEQKNLVSRLKIPQGVGELRWNDAKKGIFGKNDEGNILFEVNEMDPPQGEIKIDKNKYGVGVDGVNVMVSFTGEFYQQSILDKGIDYGTAIFARGLIKNEDGSIKSLDFLVGFNTPEDESFFLNENGQKKDGKVVVRSLKRGQELSVRTPFDVDKKTFIELCGNVNSTKVCEAIWSFYRDTMALTKHNISAGEFPFYYQFPTLDISK